MTASTRRNKKRAAKREMLKALLGTLVTAGTGWSIGWLVSLAAHYFAIGFIDSLAMVMILSGYAGYIAQRAVARLFAKKDNGNHVQIPRTPRRL